MTLELVIFDCDGVLVDSEPVANRVVAQSLTERGWPMTAAESERMFLGQSLAAMEPTVAARLGAEIAGPWAKEVASRVVIAMQEEAEPVPGALAALAAVEARGLAWRVASNSSHAELAAKLARIGLDAPGRVHSFEDVARGKPAPDLFLAAAAAEGVDPAACLVIEDSLVGITAAGAAGMAVVALVRHGAGGEHARAGARVIDTLAALPGLLDALLGGSPR